MTLNWRSTVLRFLRNSAHRGQHSASQKPRSVTSGLEDDEDAVLGTLLSYIDRGSKNLACAANTGDLQGLAKILEFLNVYFVSMHSSSTLIHAILYAWCEQL